MATSQDWAVGFKKESTYGTAVTVDRFLENVDIDLDWKRNTKQGKGTRVSSRAARSNRRANPTAKGQGGFTTELISKGCGTLLELCMGSGTSTNVAAALYQQLFTFADAMPFATIQKQVPYVNSDGTFSISAETYKSCMVSDFELDFPAEDILTLKANFLAKDLTTATAAASVSYPSGGTLFTFAGGTVSSGTITAPTTTALATGTTSLATVRSGSVTVNHNLTERMNLTGTGRMDRPTVGLRDIGVKLDVEFSGTTFRDAVIADTAMLVILNFTTGVVVGGGTETLQIVIPEVKFDGELPKPNGTDLAMQSMSGVGLDNLSAAQPLWIVVTTADTAL